MFTGARKKTGHGLAAGCQLFYRKIYGYFLQCSALFRLGAHVYYLPYPGLLYLPILLFEFGTSQQTNLVLLIQDHYKENFFKFLHNKSLSL